MLYEIMGKATIIPMLCICLAYALVSHYSSEIVNRYKIQHSTKIEQALNKSNINFPLTLLNDERAQLLGEHILFEETFEGNNPLSAAVSLQTGTNYGFKIVSDPVYRGAKSGRFELRASDPMVHRGKRSELYVIDRITHRERWYSFAVYFPSDGYANDSSNELISQWHQGGSPAISLRTVNNKFYLRILNSTDDENWKVIDLAPLVKNTWHEFVFHIIHSSDKDALIEIWHNGQNIVKYKGRNHYKDKKMPYWKLGVYKAKWNHNKTDTDLRVVYFDDIRVGDEFASFADMALTYNKSNGIGFRSTDKQEL